MLAIEERGNRSTRRKPLGAEQRANKLSPHMTPDLDHGPHWWEASALTTAPSHQVILNTFNSRNLNDIKFKSSKARADVEVLI